MKTILVLLALSLSVSAMAQDRGHGRLSLRDGSTIIRVNVGSDRENDSRENAKRIANLERAVRELQNRVYDLEDDARPTTREVKVYTCSLTSAFKGAYIGKGRSEVEARADAMQRCTMAADDRSAFFCGEERIKGCQATVEIERI
jgi:hypothetical protein